MADIVWDSSWDIGHAGIDQQHQKWVELLNRLKSSFASPETADFNELRTKILGEVYDYTCYHFSTEEKYMQDSGYPDAARHRRLHKEFDAIVYTKFRDIQSGQLLLTSDLITLMKNWLISHIQLEDMKFGHYLKPASESD